MLAVFSASAVALNEDINMESQMVQNSPGFHRRVIIKTAFA